MSVEAQELQFTKNNLYRDHYKIALNGAIFMGIVCALLSVILAMVSLYPPQTKYYATTTTGIIVPLHSLSEPVVTKPYLLQWASLAAKATYNLDFNDYKKQMVAAETYFTNDGFLKYKEALKESGLLNTVTDKKVMMSAIVSGDPVIVREFIEYGRYNWVVQLPMLVTFSSASDTKRIHTLVTMRIQRVPVLNANNGIQISNYRVN